MFTIPTNDLGDYTTEALRRLRDEARTEYNTAFAAAQENLEATTDEDVDRLTALRAFVEAVDTRLTELSVSHRRDQLDTLTPIAPATQPGPDPDPVPVPATEPPAPSIVDVAPGAPNALDAVANNLASVFSITASADVPGFTSGQTLDTIGELSRAILARSQGYETMRGEVAGSHSVALISPPSTEFVCTGERSEDLRVLAEATNEHRLNGGSLVQAMLRSVEAGASLTAAAGWCAPSELDYSVRFNGVASGLLDAPTVQAPRGGLWSMPELTFSDVYNTGTSYFNLTELEVIAGATKSFVEILCPTPIEYRLGVTGFGAIANLLELRAYPEYVNKYIAALMVGLQHHLNRLRIAAIVTGSTAVDLSATAPWSVDTSVISRVLPAMELAAVDIRSRLRLAENSTIEIVLPQWILAQMRADWMRRSGIGGPEGISLADSVIVRHAAMIGCRVQFVRDYQDAYSGLATGPGGAAALLKLPTTVKFLAYPAGTWVIAELDVITLSTVYDAVRLAANQRLEAFVETGWRMIPKGPISREYEVDVCPSGGTGVSAAITC